jgi:hypothetical protein
MQPGMMSESQLADFVDRHLPRKRSMPQQPIKIAHAPIPLNGWRRCGLNPKIVSAFCT